MTTQQTDVYSYSYTRFILQNTKETLFDDGC